MSDLVVDACPLLHALSGIGRYTHEVSRRLGDLGGAGLRLRFHYGPVADSAPAPGRSNLPWIMRCRVPYAAHLWVHLQHRLQRNGRRGWDTYWEPNNACPFDVAPRRLVLTLHDFSWLHHARWHPRARVRFMRERVPWSVARADAIITGTRHTRDEIVDQYGVDPSRIAVIPHGVDREAFRPRRQDELEVFRRKYRLEKPFVLYLGSLNPRKNVQVVLRAWRTLRASLRADCELILASNSGWNNDELLPIIAQEPSIRIVQHAQDAELPSFYSAASLFVFPSLYEGFGLPPLEALACGCRIAVSDAPPMPEVCGPGATYLPPLDVDAWREAMARHLQRSIDRDRAPDRSFQVHLRKYSWDESARRHFDLFRTVA